MKWYWTKIVVTALVIFCIGFAGISAVRATKRRVTEVAESTTDISIPLPFVPFTFDGARSGTFRKLVFHRSDPHQLNGVDLIVKLTDSALLKRLEGCSLTVDNPTQINSNTTFRCAGADSGLEEFGQVILETGGGSAEAERIPFKLLIPKKVVADLRGHGSGAKAAEKLQAERFRELSDSMKTLGLSLAGVLSDSARDAIKERMDDLKSEMDDARDALVEAAQAKAEAAGQAAERAQAAPTPPTIPAKKPRSKTP